MFTSTGCTKRLLFKIQFSALIQTTYCIQFQWMQFHMFRSFSSSPMLIKLCVFTHSSFRSILMMNFKELRGVYKKSRPFQIQITNAYFINLRNLFASNYVKTEDLLLIG